MQAITLARASKRDTYTSHIGVVYEHYAVGSKRRPLGSVIFGKLLRRWREG